ncbi:hypothetical protein BsWGS_12160 [Bradybaena similaris]
MILKLLILTVLVTDAFGGLPFFGDGDYGYESDNCESPFKCPKDIKDLAKRSAIRTACIQATDPVCKDKNSNIRSIDGSCNHKYNIGATLDTIGRVIPNAYGDHLGSARVLDSEGKLYTSANTIVEEILTDEDKPAPFTVIGFQAGQFFSHDILDTSTGKSQDCCNRDTGCPQAAQHPSCLPIVTRNSTTNQTTCTNFVRSESANCTNFCKVGNIFNFNEVTAFLDLSTLYGSNNKTAADVRAFDGLLKTLKTEKGDFLPNASNGTKYTPLAGDGRANQQTFLTAVHTIFLRAHNAIARKLKALLPNATDEQLYQLTRKILISIYQHIIYCQYLPHLLGHEVAEIWGLCTKTGRSKYDSNIEPRIIHEFGDVCNRMGHSQVPRYILLGDILVVLRNFFGRGELILTAFRDFILALIGYSKTNTTTGAQTVDLHISKEVSQFLFFNNATGRGGNLPATNIQRGRDHGTPLWLAFRKLCCLKNVTGFDDRDVLGDNGKKLQKIYKNLEDVEAFLGVLAERIKQGMVGETIACILALQFSILKLGDKFFYDTSNKQLGWGDEQLRQIRQGGTMALLVCLTGEVETVQRDVFLFPSEKNPYVNCTEIIKAIDFSKFQPY